MEDVTPILDSLNDAQRQAVSAPVRGHSLVLAGAGSGKTRVLVHRIAWLVEVEKISPFSILAVTFTNKAALEMRARAEQMLGIGLSGMWLGTFHGLCHRFLRSHWQEAGLTDNFQIIDSEDQKRLIRKIQKELGMDDGKWPPKKTQGYINRQKEYGRRVSHLAVEDNPHAAALLQVYEAYEQHCQRAQIVDFTELLLRTLETLEQQPDVLQHYQTRFSHILIDEFQDTNTIQYRWIKLLAGDKAQVMAVGDDDQSIYSWRGAKVENIARFEREFSEVNTYRLEQNYRSTGNILAAANAVITHNSNRMGKELWTDGDPGELLSLYSAFNEIDEARFVVQQIQHWYDNNPSYNDIAILYRSNAQSRVLEEHLNYAGIPYRVYGGLRFFDRAEIKDAIAYMRLVVNHNDDTAFERVVNTPTRGIGHTTQDKLRQFAREHNLSLWQATQQMIAQQALTSRAATALQGFITLIDSLIIEQDAMSLSAHTDMILHTSGLIEHYRQEKSERGESKVENLEELQNAVRQFTAESEDQAGSLADFLSRVLLDSSDHQQEASSDYVQLMTLHAAKGLEFALVFITGLEDGLFPHQMSIHDADRLEEERRLCYVGMTRAMRKLVLTYAQTRRLHGKESFQRLSRFISEVPSELLQEVRLRHAPESSVASRQSITSNTTAPGEATGGYRLGQHVHHATFGDGVILNMEGSGSHARVQVRFAEHGVKWLLTSFAPLTTH